MTETIEFYFDFSSPYGYFGSPFIFVEGEGFWGSDRLWMVRRWLRSGGW